MVDSTYIKLPKENVNLKDRVMIKKNLGILVKIAHTHTQKSV